MLETADHPTDQHTESQAMQHAAPSPSQKTAQHVDVPPVQVDVPVMETGRWLEELDADMSADSNLPPQAPRPSPPPKRNWFGRLAKPARPAPADDEPPGQVKSRLPFLKPLLYISLCGIGVLSYLQYGQSLDKDQDLLGTTLPSVEPTGPTDPDLIMPAIDPRLGGPDALSLGVPAQPTQPLEDAAGPAVEAMDALAQANTPLGTLNPIEPLHAEAAAAAPATAAPAIQPAVHPMAQPSVDPALDERMRRMEDLMLQMSQQLAQMKTQQAAAAVAGTTAPAAVAPATPRAAAQPAPMPQPAPAATAPAQRTLVQAEPAKAAAPVRAVQPQRVARAQPAAKPKVVVAEEPAKLVATGPRLVSVDMWNGEPSVVVVSGIPGDKRMRVLRPGDVVNGLALRSVDPVTRSVTFAGPENRSINLSMATGG